MVDLQKCTIPNNKQWKLGRRHAFVCFTMRIWWGGGEGELRDGMGQEKWVTKIWTPKDILFCIQVGSS